MKLCHTPGTGAITIRKTTKRLRLTDQEAHELLIGLTKIGYPTHTLATSRHPSSAKSQRHSPSWPAKWLTTSPGNTFRNSIPITLSYACPFSTCVHPSPWRDQRSHQAAKP